MDSLHFIDIRINYKSEKTIYFFFWFFLSKILKFINPIIENIRNTFEKLLIKKGVNKIQFILLAQKNLMKLLKSLNTEKDINEIGVTLFENNGYVSMEIFSNIKHISLTLIHGVLKCFGNYKILNIEEGDIKTGTIFVNTDLPIVVYGEPLGHITKQMINDYQNALKS